MIFARREYYVFSKHNEKTVYVNHHSGLLEVEGEGLLCREDAEVWPAPGRNWARGYDTLSVTEGITGLGEGYLDAFSHIDCLILSRTVDSVAVTPELLKRMHRRKVLIRGEYDTFAEGFAKDMPWCKSRLVPIEVIPLCRG